MLPHVKEILEKLLAVFDEEMERLGPTEKDKAAGKKISKKRFFLNANVPNIADGLFKVLESVPEAERIPIIVELIKSLDKKFDGAELDCQNPQAKC